jgi:hypothetical protein
MRPPGASSRVCITMWVKEPVYSWKKVDDDGGYGLASPPLVSWPMRNLPSDELCPPRSVVLAKAEISHFE